MADRIEIFTQMLAADPENSMVMFGLANEYLKNGAIGPGIEMLERYLASADDEGAAYGMLGRAYAEIGDREKALSSFEKGIEVSLSHGHPSMAEEFREIIENDL